MICDEAQELITALVDEELVDPERVALETHLQQCARCQIALEEERALKTAIGAAGDRVRAPAQLRNRILSDHRLFPEKRRSGSRWYDYIAPLSHIPRPALFVALLLAIALPTIVFFNQRSQPIALAALETYGFFLKGDLAAIRAKTPDQMKAQLIRAVDGKFHPMGYDLATMKLWPVAGAVREIQGRKILIVIYQGQGGSLLCYTFLGSEEDAPPNAATFFDSAKKMNFYAFSRGTVNAVLHREGDVVCLLVSEMPMDSLLALTKSKARPA